MLRLDNTHFIFQDGPGIEEKLRELGMKTDSKEAALTEPDIHFYSSPDTHGQVYALGKIVGAVNESKEGLDERTVVVLPSSDTLFPLIRQGLTVIEEKDYNISLGYPFTGRQSSAFSIISWNWSPLWTTAAYMSRTISSLSSILIPKTSISTAMQR